MNGSCKEISFGNGHDTATTSPLALVFFLTSTWRVLYCYSFIGICVSYCVFEFFVYRFYQLHKCSTNLWSSTCSYLFISAPGLTLSGILMSLEMLTLLLDSIFCYLSIRGCSNNMCDTFRAQPMKPVNTCKKCSQYAAPSSLPCVYGLGEGGRK